MTKSAFIMVASRSGSALLDSHPLATTIGDTESTSYGKYSDSHCSCGYEAKGRLFDFVALDPDKCHQELRTVENHVVDNKIHFSSEQVIRLDNKWRTELERSNITGIENSTYIQLQKYVYANGTF